MTEMCSSCERTVAKESELSGYSRNSLMGPTEMDYHLMQKFFLPGTFSCGRDPSPGILAFWWHRGEEMTFLLLPLQQSQRRAEGCNHIDILFSIFTKVCMCLIISICVCAGISITLH